MDKNYKEDRDFQKELEIPSKYILINTPNRLICAVPNDEVENFKKAYQHSHIEIFHLNDYIAKKHVI